jgi:hypothetical protein
MSRGSKKLKKSKKSKRLTFIEDDPTEPRMKDPVLDQPFSLQGVDDDFLVEDEFRVVRIQSTHKLQGQVILYSFIVYLTNLSHLHFVGTL